MDSSYIAIIGFAMGVLFIGAVLFAGIWFEQNKPRVIIAIAVLMSAVPNCAAAAPTAESLGGPSTGMVFFCQNGDIAQHGGTRITLIWSEPSGSGRSFHITFTYTTHDGKRVGHTVEMLQGGVIQYCLPDWWNPEINGELSVMLHMYNHTLKSEWGEQRDVVEYGHEHDFQFPRAALVARIESGMYGLCDD